MFIARAMAQLLKPQRGDMFIARAMAPKAPAGRHVLWQVGYVIRET